MAVLRIENLSKSYGKIQAVEDLSITIESGNVYGILGPNGSGKTTLFNSLSGFLSISSGTITFQGEDVTRLKPSSAPSEGCRSSTRS